MTSTTSQLQNTHTSMAASMANAHGHFLNAIFVMPVLNPGRTMLLDGGTSHPKESFDTPRPKGSFPWSVALILFLAFTSCKSEYRYLKPAKGDVHCIEQFTPRFENTLYTAYIDVTKHHLSGLLFFKRMPDSSMRVVFTNEMGVKFFDFEFAKDGAFTKYYILSKLDKKVIVNALRNDMELVLLRPDMSDAKMLQDSVLHYIAVPAPKGNNYYVTNVDCTRLVRIEKASKRKAVVTASLLNYNNGVPDSIGITHNNFKFNIALKRTER